MSETDGLKNKGFTLIELMIVIAVIAIIAALAVPSILAATRAGNERNASGSLKQMATAQVTFKTSDSDGNGINDYWVNDIAGFYYITPTGSVPLKLIEMSVCLADGNNVPGLYLAPPAPHVSSPKAGYWYQTLVNFEEFNGVSYVANLYSAFKSDRFGVISYPNAYGSSGKLVFVLSDQGTMYKRDPASGGNVVSAAPATGVADNGGVLNATTHYDTFPLDALSSTSSLSPGPWSKMD